MTGRKNTNKMKLLTILYRLHAHKCNKRILPTGQYFILQSDFLVISRNFLTSNKQNKLRGP
jgi:hypothetical protein